MLKNLFGNSSGDIAPLVGFVERSKEEIDVAFQEMYDAHGSEDIAPNKDDVKANPLLDIHIQKATFSIISNITSLDQILQSKLSSGKPIGFSAEEALGITDFLAKCNQHYDQIREYVKSNSINGFYDSLEAEVIKHIALNTRKDDVHSYALGLKSMEQKNWPDKMKIKALRGVMDNNGKPTVSIFYEASDNNQLNL